MNYSCELITAPLADALEQLCGSVQAIADGVGIRHSDAHRTVPPCLQGAARNRQPGQKSASSG